ncbi:FecR domain-containing protein [Pseudoduganella sp. LjRoot289]|uniref:FecR family protein n=1 Tax=Pseudoduganella sp. LjRoot289 TaxID=3342314 RepID=UPI003ECF7C43
MSTIDNEALQWVICQTRGALDDAERAAFDAWYAADIRHQGAYLRARAINRALDQAQIQKTLRPRLERLALEWAGASWNQANSRRTFMKAGGAAAGIAALAVAAVLRAAPDRAVLTTAKGEFRKVPLADKSVATINSGSRIELRLTQQKRQVSLTRGEAWFEVAKDKSKPFIVDTGEVLVRAVGTAFGVRRYANGAEVLVTEGTVEVWSKDGSAQKRLLTAGEHAFVDVHATEISVARQPREVERKLAWREGKLIFNNQTLSEAVADFNRYSPRKIIIVDPQLWNRKLVGQYQIDAPELFAKDVSTFLDVPIVITADKIMIGDAHGVDGKKGNGGSARG